MCRLSFLRNVVYERPIYISLLIFEKLQINVKTLVDVCNFTHTFDSSFLRLWFMKDSYVSHAVCKEQRFLDRVNCIFLLMGICVFSWYKWGIGLWNKGKEHWSLGGQLPLLSPRSRKSKWNLIRMSSVFLYLYIWMYVCIFTSAL